MEISVHEWKSEQVIEWLKGIECINFYIKAFANNRIDGRALLDLRNSELHELGIISVGHQEVILEAVAHLKDFHYNIDKENLQFLSMQVGSLSTSLYKLLERDKSGIGSINTQILSEVTRTLSKIKTLISWLDRSPFQGHTQYSEIRVRMLKLGLELATISQRDPAFVHDPIAQIKNLAKRLSQLSDYIIQDITDPMLLQPAYLDLVTLKKRESEFGFYVQPSYQFIHRVTDIKYNSPAHNSGKIEDGDEIVQINYQTVVGWQYKKVLLQLQESSTDVLLTLKKRPKHTKIYGQLGLIKLPSKKRSIPYRWDNLPSPRFELFNVPDLLLPLAIVEKKDIVSDAEDSSGNESDVLAEIKVDKETRLYMPKPRASVLQRRRHTICGEDLANFQSIGNLVLWHNRKNNIDNLESPSLRDKSVSFGFGLELTQRPTTCLGISDNLPISRLKTSLPSMPDHKSEVIEESDEKPDLLSAVLSAGVSKVVRFDSNRSLEYNNDLKYVCNVEDTIIESFMPIPYVDEEFPSEAIEEIKIQEPPRKLTPPKPAPRKSVENRMSDQFIEAVNTVVVNREIVKRGRLDKSHSTPTYTDESDVPPAIEPRQQTVVIPPVPPRKNVVVIPPITIESNDENKSRVANVIDLKGTKTAENTFQAPLPLQRTPSTSSLTKQKFPLSMPIPIDKPRKPPPVDRLVNDNIIELVTPAKVKTLTNKKKNSLMAKRRKVIFKSLGLGTSTTIQGHLYRRAKDKTDVAYWAKLYFVLIETALYGFKNKEAQRADCVIFLNGFTVSLAKEVHSKQFAFKVYHPKKTFYLAAETKEALAQWMEYIKQAAMKGTTNLDCEPRELYSETECSEEETDFSLGKQLCTPSPLKPLNEKMTLNDQTPPTSKTHYHINFGSLKKFARGSNASPNNINADNSSPSDHKFLGFFSTSKSAEKKSADIVPTAQFKTYKKVKENSGGLQLGATSMINSTVSDMYLQNGADSSIISGFTSYKKSDDVMPLAPAIHRNDFLMEEENFEEKTDKSFKHNKRSLNYLHASNPNLLDFNYHSAGDFPMSSSSNHSSWDHHQGSGMTLFDLMNQQLDEEKKQMYNRRVEQGVEKAEDKTLLKRKEKPAIPPKPADPHIEKIQKRSLPVTPDYAQSFKPDDMELKFTRTKEGQKLRDFGYEFISGDDSSSINSNVTDVSKYSDKLWPSKRCDKVVPASGSLKKKSGFNWMIGHEKEDVTTCLGSSGSFRKSKNKLEGFKNDKGLKGSSSFVAQPNSQITSKVLRKNSAPNSGSSSVIPYFSKLAFSSSSCKEKKLLGSPKLHRAIFGSKTHTPSTSNADNEIFTSITFPKFPRTSENSSRKLGIDHHSPDVSSVSSFPMYPDLQQSLPPIFKPEIYSLKNARND